MAKTVRTNRFNVEWTYAKQCWDALVAQEPLPPIPHYQIFEAEEGKPETLVNEKLINPKQLRYRGIIYYYRAV